MAKYRRKPITVEAFIFDGTHDGSIEIVKRIKDNGGKCEVKIHPERLEHYLEVENMMGEMMKAFKGWVVVEKDGDEYFTMPPHRFEEQFERAY